MNELELQLQLQILCNIYQQRTADELDNKHIERLTELDNFINDFCSYTDVNILELRSKNRKRHLVDLRVMISTILRDNYKLSLQRIGLILSRDHASIIHYLKKHDVYTDKIFGDEGYIIQYTRLKDLRLWQ
jgi:chromosomal replication initiation ATPase DnaA